MPTKALRQIALDLHRCDSLKAQHINTTAELRAIQAMSALQDAQIAQFRQNFTLLHTEHQHIMRENHRYRWQNRALLGTNALFFVVVIILL
jgi:hypothetical protein